MNESAAPSTDTSSPEPASVDPEAAREIDPLSRGLSRTWSVLEKFPQREHAAAIVGAALEEPSLRARALDALLDESHPRAAREVVRHFGDLPADLAMRAAKNRPAALLRATRQLSGSHRSATRENVAHAASELAHARSGSERDDSAISTDEIRDELARTLSTLIDDPQPVVRDRARAAFLELTSEIPPADFGRFPRRHPVTTGLLVLLENFERHADERVLVGLLEIGGSALDTLGRNAGNHDATARAIESMFRETDGLASVELIARALVAWLRSPAAATRDLARKLLRERSDAAFLRVFASRLESTEPGVADEASRAARHLRWDRIPIADLDSLPVSIQLRIVAALQAGAHSAEDRASRLTALLAAASPEVVRQILESLREFQAHGLGEALRPAFRFQDETIERIATELIDMDIDAPAYDLLFERLKSPSTTVRGAALRKISGHGLRIYFDAFDNVDAPKRKKLLPVLEKIDPHFQGELRRALRAPDEDTQILALRTVLDHGDLEPYEEILFDLTVNPSPRVRATLARTFALAPVEVSLHYLRLFLADDDPRVVANTIETLSRFDDARARGWIAEKTSSPHARVAVNALLALARAGDPSATARIRELASDRTAHGRSAEWALTALDAA